jgi:hypothetical protein
MVDEGQCATRGDVAMTFWQAVRFLPYLIVVGLVDNELFNCVDNGIVSLANCWIATEKAVQDQKLFAYYP